MTGPRLMGRSLKVGGAGGLGLLGTGLGSTAQKLKRRCPKLLVFFCGGRGVWRWGWEGGALEEGGRWAAGKQ